MAKTILTYTGKKEFQPSPDELYQGHAIYPYLPSKELVEAVNLAIFLERPLLIRGEPGCGKTKLALAVAHELQLPYEMWPVKSTSRAEEGLYTYDAVRRLHDGQLLTVKRDDKDLEKRVDDPEQYIEWGPLGKAFRSPKKTVVLIDEIDKADIDFPNDLLLELDEQRFIVKELGNKSIEAEEPPIVFITSNDEKDLPDAFLRRCIFHYITFPDEARLFKILKARFPESTDESEGKVVREIISFFMTLRDKMENDKHRMAKKVSTSELLDWYKALRKHHPDDEIFKKLSEKFFFYPGALVKTHEDYQRYVCKKDA